MSWFSKAFKSIFKAPVWKQVLKFGAEILKATAGKMGDELQEVAFAAVKRAEAKGGSGTQKFEAAYNEVVSYFKKGTFAERIINAAIENAVLALTSQKKG